MQCSGNNNEQAGYLSGRFARMQARVPMLDTPKRTSCGLQLLSCSVRRGPDPWQLSHCTICTAWTQAGSLRNDTATAFEFRVTSAGPGILQVTAAARQAEQIP